jgi:hypothetical protein
VTAAIAHSVAHSGSGPGRGALERAFRELVERDGTARPHQGVGNELINGRPSASAGELVETKRLSGLLRSYHRAA